MTSRPKNISKSTKVLDANLSTTVNQGDRATKIIKRKIIKRIDALNNSQLSVSGKSIIEIINIIKDIFFNNHNPQKQQTQSQPPPAPATPATPAPPAPALLKPEALPSEPIDFNKLYAQSIESLAKTNQILKGQSQQTP
jgi:hypothetical protein